MSHPHECNDEPKLTAEEWDYIAAVAEAEKPADPEPQSDTEEEGK